MLLNRVPWHVGAFLWKVRSGGDDSVPRMNNWHAPKPTPAALQCELYFENKVLRFGCYNRTFSVEPDTARNYPPRKPILNASFSFESGAGANWIRLGFFAYSIALVA